MAVTQFACISINSARCIRLPPFVRHGDYTFFLTSALYQSEQARPLTDVRYPAALRAWAVAATDDGRRMSCYASNVRASAKFRGGHSPGASPVQVGHPQGDSPFSPTASPIRPPAVAAADDGRRAPERTAGIRLRRAPAAMLLSAGCACAGGVSRAATARTLQR
jgi:hypothetical protein